jgi:hypothetical protein
MGDLSFFFGQAVVHAPVVLVLVAGVILLASAGARLPGRSRSLALAGVVVLLVGVLLGLAWSMALPWLVGSQLSTQEWGVASFVVNLLLTLWQAVGLGLLLGAVLTRSRAAGAG